LHKPLLLLFGSELSINLRVYRLGLEQFIHREELDAKRDGKDEFGLSTRDLFAIWEELTLFIGDLFGELKLWAALRC
jgi:hypothetical protein